MFSVFSMNFYNGATKIVICYDCKLLVSFYLWQNIPLLAFINAAFIEQAQPLSEVDSFNRIV